MHQLVKLRRSATATSVLRIAIGLLFLTTAVAKLVDIRPNWDSPILRYSIPAVAEAALAGWLLSGYLANASLLTSIIALCAFFGLSIRKTIAGETTCGCFGQHVILSPAYSLTLSSSVLILYAIVSHRYWTSRLSARLLSILGTTAIVTVTMGYMFGPYFSPLSLGNIATPTEDTPGTKWARLSGISTTVDLSEGRWCVVLFSLECDSCREELPGLIALATENNINGTDHFVFVEVSPFHPHDLTAFFGSDSANVGRYLHPTDDILELPSATIINNGIVVSNEHGRLSQTRTFLRDALTVPPKPTRQN